VKKQAAPPNPETAMICDEDVLSRSKNRCQAGPGAATIVRGSARRRTLARPAAAPRQQAYSGSFDPKKCARFFGAAPFAFPCNAERRFAAGETEYRGANC